MSFSEHLSTVANGVVSVQKSDQLESRVKVSAGVCYRVLRSRQWLLGRSIN